MRALAGMGKPTMLNRFIKRLRRSERRTAMTAAVAATPRHALAPARDARTEPPLDPLRLAQWLWGDGFLVPGDADHVAKLGAPLLLSSAHTALVLGAGLGGPVRALTDAYQCYAVGYEADPVIAEAGMARSKALRVEKRAMILPYDPEAVNLKPRGFNAAIARCVTASVTKREAFVTALARAIRPGGSILMTEYVVGEGSSEMRADWVARMEARTGHPLPPLWTAEEYSRLFSGLGCDVRILEDSTPQQRMLVLQGWERLLRDVDLRSLSRPHLVTVLNEAEYWMRHIMTLESGAVRVMRLFALAAR